MPRCTRNGCAAEFASGASDVCKYHPGTPVFHEGLKSWSCCQHVNKPELDFEEFMKISGCTEAETHSDAQVQSPSKLQSIDHNITAEQTADGKELFQVKPQSDAVPPSNGGAPATTAMPATPVPVLELDDLNKEVAVGTVCRRKGCGITFVSNEVNRRGDGEGTVCSYHPLPPLFREGSKGYLCCKRRVLEFDEFLKIKGCKIGRHVFVPVTNELQSEEQVNCRIDHYQTRDQVHVTVYAKQVDKNRSSVQVGEDKVTLDLFLPGMKRFSRSLELFGDIDASSSSFQILGTKVELRLQKSDARVWTVLEKTDRDLGNISLTFGVGGKTGTVGAKDVILDERNKART
ncbi:chord-domain-containing protein [Phlegmacium glaucopus]|nr:chord-domain-containing protein [Phlegmacium glaucopus]